MGSHNDLATISITIISKVGLPGLLLGAHEFSHSNLDFTDRLKVATTITVDKHELIVLDLLKEVCECERVLEVWIKVVFDLFSLADFDPVVVFLFVQDALGVRLAKGIQVFQFATGYE